MLAIAAAKLGFAPVAALDSDRAAVEATLRNARDNGVALDRVERYDLRRDAAAGGRRRRREPDAAAAAAGGGADGATARAR